jgi:hypothetical protein
MHSFWGDWLLVRKESPIVPGHFLVIFPPTMRTDVERHSGRPVVNWVPSKHFYTVAFKVQRAGGRSTRVKIVFLFSFFFRKGQFYCSLKITKCHLFSSNNLLNSHQVCNDLATTNQVIYSQHSKLYFT